MSPLPKVRILRTTRPLRRPVVVAKSLLRVSDVIATAAADAADGAAARKVQHRRQRPDKLPHYPHRVGRPARVLKRMQLLK